MLGNMISKIRKDRKLTKTELANLTNVDISHLTHIEKGQRIPSHKLLISICNTLKVPYRPFFNAYDKNLTEEQLKRCRTLVKNELNRATEFSRIAINMVESESILDEIKDAYGVQFLDFESQEDENYEW